MSKKNLLNEATIRRFMKLSGQEALTNPFVDRLSEEWGEKKGEYKRRDVGGVEKKAGDVGGHYKDYEMNEDDDWGEKKGEYRRRDVGGVEKKAGDVGGHYKDYEVNEDAEEERELHATEDELSDEDAEADREGDELDALEADDAAGELPADVRDRVEDALAGALEALAAELGDSLGVDLDVEAAPEEVDMEVDMEMDAPAGDEEVEVDA